MVGGDGWFYQFFYKDEIYIISMITNQTGPSTGQTIVRISKDAKKEFYRSKRSHIMNDKVG